MKRQGRWKRQQGFVSPPSVADTHIGTRCSKSALLLIPQYAQTVYSYPLLLSMSLLYILCGVTVVSALSVPSLPFTRLRGGALAIRASPLSDADTVSLFSRVLSSDTLHESVEKDCSEKNTKRGFPHSERQLKSIHSNAPAVLLKSGPGTGKTYALASRIAHLIQSGSCRPEQMVVLSFTNRDAHTLKERAVQMYKRQCGYDNEATVTCKEVMDRLWSGTIHAFASSIIRTSSKTHRQHFRVINSKEMRVRVDKCLCLLLDKKHYANREGPSIAKLKQIRILHRDALTDLRQSRGILLHQVCRCFDLWKEAGVLPPPCVVGSITKVPHNLDKQSVRDDCVELSMRLGISQNVAVLAIELYPQYQTLHESHGTADPSDLAAIATNILTSDTRALAAFRTKLKHVILDEYQDVSVTQHTLIRTIVRGIVDQKKKDEAADSRMSLPPVLDTVVPSQTDSNVCFEVPRLFCGGDSQQSIYGWRGAAPYISTEGFSRDYPQGIVVPLDTSFRLSDEVWNTANCLIDPKKTGNQKMNSRSTMPENMSSLEPENQDQSIRILFSKVSSEDELFSPIRVQGLWDAREEGKFIASAIRKRCKARMKLCSDALGQKIGRDPSDVAVMVRSGKQLAFIKEALASVGVPFVVCTSEEDASMARSAVSSNLKLIDMKPVVVMTMHRAKGEEFDDVYLAGWTEGVFPHPTSVSSNRVDEERRLAFVAISRARQQVVITHSFTDRVLHNGPNLTSRYVTQQVSPSRFLYELVPAARTSSADTVHNGGTIEKTSSKGFPSVVWYRGKGIKEHMAGGNVPDYFVNSYKAGSSYLPAQSTNQAASGGRIKEKVSGVPLIVESESDLPEATQESNSVAYFDRLTFSDQELLNHVRGGLDDICDKKVRGSKGKFKSLFRDLLGKRFNLKRGHVLVLPTEEDNVFYDALLGFEQKHLKKKPLSRATAIELGQYICYRLLSLFMDSSK